uniref:alpha-amylase family glycosyl hydrolase n=1 Tax=Companilactobacillus paralimentarius TaxID=83526 RepID=UPI00221F4A2F|nr:alpha-amylase family glycosyl hydrolase [Companilactobacillus paralimentarius]
MGHYKLTDLTSILSAWQTQMQRHGGWNALFWNNHDQPRAISRFTNDDEYRDQSAKLLAMVEFGLQGTPYIYQGDEIAMKNAYFTDIKQYKDHESINAYHEMLKMECLRIWHFKFCNRNREKIHVYQCNGIRLSIMDLQQVNHG